VQSRQRGWCRIVQRESGRWPYEAHVVGGKGLTPHPLRLDAGQGLPSGACDHAACDQLDGCRDTAGL
jgi:hypothetical protein